MPTTSYEVNSGFSECVQSKAQSSKNAAGCVTTEYLSSPMTNSEVHLPTIWDEVIPGFSDRVQSEAQRAKSAAEYATTEDLDSLIELHTDFNPSQRDPCNIEKFQFPHPEGGVDNIKSLFQQSSKGITNDDDFAASLDTKVKTLRAQYDAQKLDVLKVDCAKQREDQTHVFLRETAGHAGGMRQVLLARYTPEEVDSMNGECKKLQFQKIKEEQRLNDRRQAHAVAVNLLEDSMWKSKLEKAKELYSDILSVDSEANLFQAHVDEAQQKRINAAKIVQDMEKAKEEGQSMIESSKNHKNRACDELDDARLDCKNVARAMLDSMQKFNDKRVENEAARMKVNRLQQEHDMHCHRLEEAKRQLQDTEKVCDQWQQISKQHKQTLCEKVASSARKCKDDAHNASEEAALNCQLAYQMLNKLHGELNSELAVVEDELAMYTQNKQAIEEQLSDGGEEDLEDLECELADLTDKEKEHEDRRDQCVEFLDTLASTLQTASQSWSFLQGLAMLSDSDERRLVDAAQEQVASLYKAKPHVLRTRRSTSRQIITSRSSSSSLVLSNTTEIQMLIKQEALKLVEQIKADELRSAAPSLLSSALSETIDSWADMN